MRIGIRELRQHASQYLERVKAGEVVEVTERGKLIAILSPPTAAATSRERLIAAGRLLAAKGTWQIPERRHEVDRAKTGSQTLLEQRDERFT